MFLSYEYLRSFEYDNKTNQYSDECEITDSEWIEVVLEVFFEVGVGIEAMAGAAVISAYERRKLPVVAPNLILAFQYAVKRYGYTIDEIVNYNKQHNPKYPKYEQEVQKYLILL